MMFSSVALGFYRVYQLVSQPFLIAVHKTVNVISSTGIDLFVVTIISVYRVDTVSVMCYVVSFVFVVVRRIESESIFFCE